MVMVFKQFSKMKRKMDKGHTRQFELLNSRVVHGGNPLIPFNSIVNTTKAALLAWIV